LGVLFFGARHTWVYSIISLVILLAALLTVKNNFVEGNAAIFSSTSKEKGEEHAKKLPAKKGFWRYQFRWPKTSLTLLFILFFILLIFQLIPLPSSLLIWISPETKVVVDESTPAINAMNPATIKSGWHAVSPYVYPVRMTLVHWIVYGLLFCVLVQTLNTKKRIEGLILLILVIGCFEALYGTLQAFSHMKHILWADFGRSRDVSGTFMNRNHFAAFMGMGIILAVIYAGTLFDKSGKKPGTVTRKKNFRAKIVYYLSSDYQSMKRLLIIFAGVIMALGLIFSASRAGLISVALALLVLGIFFTIRKTQRKKGILILVLFLLTSFYAFFIGIDYTVGRFSMLGSDFDVRWRFTQRAVELFQDYRWVGVGIGNFQYAYLKYQAPQDTGGFIDHAHNDWAQILTESGVVGILFMLIGLGYFLFRYVKRWRQIADSFSICMGVAPVAALTAIGVHSFFDFNMHIPANFMMLIAIIAMGHNALYLERRHHRDELTLPFYQKPLDRGGIVIFIIIFGLILWSGIWSIRHFVAESNCNTQVNLTLKLDDHPPIEEIQRAIFWDSSNAEYHYKFAVALINIRDQLKQPNNQANQTNETNQTDQINQINGNIISSIEKAIRLNPLNAEYHTRLGWEYTYMVGQPDYMTKWFPAADMSMDRAAYFAGPWAINPHLQVDLGNYWAMRSKTLIGYDPDNAEVAWEKAMWHYWKAQEMITGKKKIEKVKEEITQFVKNFYHDDEQRIRDVIK
jgi:hypothetical protein